jgi:hypothetical protein
MRTASWTDEDLTRAIPQCNTWGQVARALGLKTDGGSSYHKIRSTAAALDLDTTHFLGRSWSTGTGSGRDAEKQREAKQRWYDGNKQVYLDRNRIRAAENSARLRELKNVPCTDCGQRFPSCAMDFDHRDGSDKLANVSSALKRWSWPRLLAEIAKCDIICANCHRIRTAQRAGWFMTTMGNGVTGNTPGSEPGDGHARPGSNPGSPATPPRTAAASPP